MTPAALPAERNRLRKLYRRHRPQYDHALRLLTRRLRSRLSPLGPKATLKARVKSFDSYFAKLQRLGAEEPRRQLTDLLGLRVIVPFLQDVELAAAELRQHFEVVEEERKGEGHSFREFGYDSIHLLLAVPPEMLPEILPGSLRVCEVQLRTTLQEAWAEVEHELVYKADLQLPDTAVRRKLASLNAILTLSDLTFQELREHQIQQRRSRDRRRSRLRDASAVLPAGDLPPAPAPAVDGDLDGVRSARRLELVLNEALEAHSRSDLDRAVRLYGKVLRLEPEPAVRALVLNHRGMAYYLLGDYEAALEDLDGAVGCDRDAHRGYYNRSLVHAARKDHAAALADLDRALGLNALHVESWYLRARIRHLLRQDEGALADCRSALELEPDFAPAQRLLPLIGRRVGT